MSEQELKEVLATIERVRAANSTPERARSFLEKEGVITKTGELAEPYQRTVHQSTAR